MVNGGRGGECGGDASRKEVGGYRRAVRRSHVMLFGLVESGAVGGKGLR